MRKEKIVILQCVDCSADEAKLILNELQQLDLPYRFIVSNREIKVLTKKEFKEAIKAFAELAEK